MSDAQRPEAPAEAKLIQAALKKSRLTARRAASKADLSEARWRQIVSGYQSVSGSYIPVKAPAETLARMAQVVGVTPDELTKAGRADAATELADLELLAPPASTGYASDPHIDAIAALLATLPPEAQEEVLRRVGRTTPQADDYGLPERQSRHAG
ncbi:helix-turn-helix transcriptional regulator [Streptomyces sp. NPDC006207]